MYDHLNPCTSRVGRYRVRNVWDIPMDWSESQVSCRLVGTDYKVNTALIHDEDVAPRCNILVGIGRLVPP